jgi:proprotein convertase subtilisin/kexin type 5
MKKCSYRGTVCYGVGKVYQSGKKNCKTCPEGRYLDGAECPEKCPCGKYENDEKNTCDKCDNSCKCCTGPKDNECTECHNGTYLHNNKCVDDCPEGYYKSPDRKCTKCNGNCETWVGARKD